MSAFVLPTPTTRSPVAARAAVDRPRATTLTALARRAAMWLEVRRQRRSLLSLSDHMLHDLGLSRADAEGEATRPFWDLPERWR
jgi:uncharacterized protein YjiS (DUF1127 family)